MSVHVVIPDPHAHYQFNHKRAKWAGELIKDVRPNAVIVLGDSGDFPSLSDFDRGRKSFQGRSYAQDVNAHNEFQDLLWSTVKQAKRKLPRRVTLIGNHEQRIDRAIEKQPELEGIISYNDLQLDRYYDDVVHYVGNTPGIIELDGVSYAHYFISGVMGRPIGGEHPAYQLVTKKLTSCTQGHTHIFDHCVRTRADGKKILGFVAGIYQDYKSPYAGEAQKLWSSGIGIKRNVEDGVYDLEWVSIERLKKEYGRR